MKSSLLLKDKSGKPRGYILVKPDCILCKPGCKLETASKEISLIMKEQADVYCRFSLQAENTEQEIPYQGMRCPDAACICADGCIALSTDWRVSFPPVNEKESKDLDSAESGSVTAESNMSTSCTQDEAACRWPQMRWPRPVCWPNAKYTGGAWTDEL